MPCNKLTPIIVLKIKSVESQLLVGVVVFFFRAAGLAFNRQTPGGVSGVSSSWEAESQQDSELDQANQSGNTRHGGTRPFLADSTHHAACPACPVPPCTYHRRPPRSHGAKFRNGLTCARAKHKRGPSATNHRLA